MTNAHLVRAGNLTLAFGILLSTVAGTLLVVTTPAEATSTAPAAIEQATSFVTPSTRSVSWATQHTTETEEVVEPTATPEPTAEPTEAPEAPAPVIEPVEPEAAVPPVETADPDYENFKNLDITVSQTENLVNQGIRVSWTGGKPTSAGEYASNYLQFMQCWGDAATGPTPQQCQWGTPTNTVGNLLGTNASGRDLVEYEDNAQLYTNDIKRTPPRSNPNLRVFGFPFTSVKGGSEFDVSSYFTSATTNEITAARTGRDGTGSVSFETQTSLEAPHLGCGAVVASTNSARSCWLVVVPRGDHNLDGSYAPTASAAGRVKGSPLSASAWKNRVVVKLDFQPVAVSCPIGNTERRIVGSELIADAITSWQPSLCGTGTTYGFSQIGDGEGRRQIVTDVEGGSKFAVVTDPLDPATAGDAKISYAPIANSSIVVAYNIDYALTSSAAQVGKNGTQVSDLVLNARLISKLLTQSYRVDVPGSGTGDPVLTGNPRSLVTDPEFLELNPDFKGWITGINPDGLLVALGSSDANAHVWKWLASDPLAAAFLKGEADEWGMKINSSYLSLNLATAATDNFPKADLTTYRVSPAPEPGFGTLDMRPYMNDMHEAAYRTLKADANVKITWDETKEPASYVSAGPQLPGQRFMLTLTDSASAERYGLSTARLVNPAGQAVGATDAAVTKAIEAMPDSTVAGVKLFDPNIRTLGAYPLSMPTYAAINACATSKATIKDYASLLSYAIGAGQVSGSAAGQLPNGYVPVSAASVKATKAVIKKLGSTTPGKGECAVVKEEFEEFDDSGTTFVPDDFTETEPAPAPTADPEEVEEFVTSDSPMSNARLGLLGALALGLPSMIAGPLLTKRGRRLSEIDDL